jgi:preprotein translocase SecE subunit
MAAEKTAEEGSIVERGSRYFSESVQELKKVSKPTRQETIQATMVAVFIVLFVSVCLFLVDIVFNRIMTAVLS